MTNKQITLKESIALQRASLESILEAPLRRVAAGCYELWQDRERMNQVLQSMFAELPYCNFLYALDINSVQISDNISRDAVISKDFGRDRSHRPYMRQVLPSKGFLLSEAYISLRARRPSLTAIQIVRDSEGQAHGFVGADFDLRDLPHTREIYQEPSHWRQVKGDPAIRGTVFHQTRTESLMDRHQEEVHGVIESLMVDHGMFHTILHYSSNRATIWGLDDPYRYRLLDIDALVDPDICLAFKRIDYPEGALIPYQKVRDILGVLGKLRVMDDVFYLRSGSLNIFNGLISLTFSCDGSHYIPYQEFLSKDQAFWIGAS